MNGDQSWSKDPDLVEVYSHLDVTATPPAPLEAVADRIAQRRRRRRGSVVAGSAVVLVAAASAVVGANTGGPDTVVAADPPASTLTVTRPDGSTFSFTDFRITCEVENGREVVVVTSGPRNPTGDSPILYFSIPVENGAGATRTHDLPPELEPIEGLDLPPGVGPQGEPPFLLFVATEDGPDGENNEVDSSEPGAAGTFAVGGAACGDDPAIDFEVDGTLGSEVEQPPLDIVGEVHLG